MIPRMHQEKFGPGSFRWFYELLSTIRTYHQVQYEVLKVIAFGGEVWHERSVNLKEQLLVGSSCRESGENR
jgi:hypothetical protein